MELAHSEHSLARLVLFVLFKFGMVMSLYQQSV